MSNGLIKNNIIILFNENDRNNYLIKYFVTLSVIFKQITKTILLSRLKEKF